jgi:putative aminopeptidase FrvX
MKPLSDELLVDRLGNVISTVKGSEPNAPSVMVHAHMDELGLIVKRIEENGFLRFERVGGVELKTLLAKEVQIDIGDGFVDGFVGSKAHHLSLVEEKFVVPQIKEMYIDIGASSREEALGMGVQIGQMISQKPNFHVMNNRYVVSKALDNRVGCLIALKLLERLKKNRPKSTIHVCGTVQEEFSIRGATPAAYRLNPDMAICLDITVACDTPDLKGEQEVALEKGPAVKLFDFHGRGELAGLIPNPKLTAFIEKAAQKEQIPIQREVTLGVLTEPAFAQLVREGIPSAGISVPTRYTHTPIETCSISDIERSMQLMESVVLSIDKSLNLARGS